MHKANRNTALEQRQRLPVEVGELRVIVACMHREALKHERIGHQHANALRAVHPVFRQRHIVEGIDHHLHLGGIKARDFFFGIAGGARLVQPFVNPFGPGHHFIVGNHGIEELRGEGGLVVFLVVHPVARPVFNRVGQEKHFPSGGASHGFHGAVFEKGIFKDALLLQTVVKRRFARGARPHLRDVSVHAVHGG